MACMAGVKLVGDGMEFAIRIDAKFPDRWAEDEVRADVIAAITSALFDRDAFQVTLTRLED